MFCTPLFFTVIKAVVLTGDWIPEDLPVFHWSSFAVYEVLFCVAN